MSDSQCTIKSRQCYIHKHQTIMSVCKQTRASATTNPAHIHYRLKYNDTAIQWDALLQGLASYVQQHQNIHIKLYTTQVILPSNQWHIHKLNKSYAISFSSMPGHHIVLPKADLLWRTLIQSWNYLQAFGILKILHLSDSQCTTNPRKFYIHKHQTMFICIQNTSNCNYKVCLYSIQIEKMAQQYSAVHYCNNWQVFPAICHEVHRPTYFRIYTTVKTQTHTKQGSADLVSQGWYCDVDSSP